MSQINEFERKATEQATGQYLSDQEVGDLYDAYLKLKEASDNGNGNKPASNYVDMPMSIEHEIVDNVLDMIEGTKHVIMDNYTENPIFHIDWIALKSQRDTLIQIKNLITFEQAEDVEAILNLIDNIQDYAVDTLGFDEDEVFNLKTEENLIGYQAMDSEGWLHPKMPNTNSVYNKSYIKQMIGDDDQWRIVPIYEGTIENPEYMFEGYPED